MSSLEVVFKWRRETISSLRRPCRKFSGEILTYLLYTHAVGSLLEPHRYFSLSLCKNCALMSFSDAEMEREWRARFAILSTGITCYPSQGQRAGYPHVLKLRKYNIPCSTSTIHSIQAHISPPLLSPPTFPLSIPPPNPQASQAILPVPLHVLHMLQRLLPASIEPKIVRLISYHLSLIRRRRSVCALSLFALHGSSCRRRSREGCCGRSCISRWRH